MKSSIGLIAALTLVFNVALSHAQVKPVRVLVDGSAVLSPLNHAVAQGFMIKNPDIKIAANSSTTANGLKKLCTAEIDVAGASLPIREAERALCAKHGIEYIELPIAYDALVMVVNAKNDWADRLSLAELKRMWDPRAQGQVTRWNQVRAAWPARPIHLYGLGLDSGGYDLFSLAVVGTEAAGRGDINRFKDSQGVARGVEADVNGIGYMSLEAWTNNSDKLKGLMLSEGGKEVAPSADNVRNGSYKLLSYPLFLYLSTKSAKRPEVSQFLEYYLASAGTLARQSGYVELPERSYSWAQKRLEGRVSGGLFGEGRVKIGLSIGDLLKLQG